MMVMVVGGFGSRDLKHVVPGFSGSVKVGPCPALHLSLGPCAPVSHRWTSYKARCSGPRFLDSSHTRRHGQVVGSRVGSLQTPPKPPKPHGSDMRAAWEK